MTAHRSRCLAATVLALPAASALCTNARAGEESPYRLSAAPARMTLGTDDLDTSGGGRGWWRNPGAFTAADSTWLTIGGGAAPDFNDNTDVNAHLAWSKFLVDDVEFMLELGVWYHNQERTDAASFNPSMVFRWHFWKSEDLGWTLYGDAGIGLLFSTDNVPNTGTSFNFTPRAGGGLTRRIGDGDARLILGVRWHHISNARIHGQERNPSRDAPMFYAGVSFPF